MPITVHKTVGPQAQRQTKSVWHCACDGPSFFYYGLEKPQGPLGGFSRPGTKAGEGVVGGGILKTPLSQHYYSNRMSGAEGRESRLREENPRAGYAVWETKIRDTRLRLLPTDPLSCGIQPAHIRMIIVAAAALGPLHRSSGRENRTVQTLS
jgi:hypothetical protein